MASKSSFKKSSSGLSDEQGKCISDNDFSEAINLFITQRKKAGISLEQLSKETKISRNVLIAIENGWEKYLPETTYLISMIKSLEIKIKLERVSLNGLLARKDSANNRSDFKFNFINIDFLNSWIGSLLYIFFMLISILALNSQQRYLIKINSISTEPIAEEKTIITNGNIINTQKEKKFYLLYSLANSPYLFKASIIFKSLLANLHDQLFSIVPGLFNRELSSRFNKSCIGATNNFALVSIPIRINSQEVKFS